MSELALSKNGCYCLNEDPHFPHTNITGHSGNPLKSDCDEQLLIQLHLNQTCKIDVSFITSLLTIITNNNYIIFNFSI